MASIQFSNSKSTTKLKEILNPQLENLLVKLHHEFNHERKNLLNNRKERQKIYDTGNLPRYDKNSEAATTNWKIKPIPKDLLTRRVEITGPVNDAKMVINMLSRNGQGHRADMAMLDFEDSMKPSWNNVVDGIFNVIAAAEGNLSFQKKSSSGQDEKKYTLDPSDMAGVMVRVRGLHLDEANVTIDGQSISGGLFDLTCSAYLAARHLISRGKTPKFYVPKCEHFMEARWWNDLFSRIEEEMGFQIGTIRATFLIETLPAAFQIEEILYELKDHAVGLNVGRWDKIFSDIKVLRMHPDRISADRSTINMQKHWMENYAKRLVKICHSHGAFAIGGMSAFTPGKDEATIKLQTEKVLNDKKNEFNSGHDGCWVSHPYFIGPALNAFPKNNQLDQTLDDFDKYPDLLMDGKGPKTIDGLKTNLRVGIAYLHGWNRNLGCVAWDNLMEDLATLEISRAQTWQWLHHEITLDSGEKVTKELILKLFNNELDLILNELKINSGSEDATAFSKAMEQAYEMFTANKLKEFLSLSSEIEKNI